MALVDPGTGYNYTSTPTSGSPGYTPIGADWGGFAPIGYGNEGTEANGLTQYAPGVAASSGPSYTGDWLQGAIQAAMGQIGGTYRLGATSADASRGVFDCSSLVQWAFNKVGASLPRLASQQNEATARVSRANLTPGDLVFTSDGSKGRGVATHVMIYIGNGKVVNAQSEQRGIRVANLSDNWVASGIAAMGDRAYGRVVQGANTPKTAAINQSKVNQGGSASPATDPNLAAYNKMLNAAAAQQARLIDAQINQINASMANQKDQLALNKLIAERNYLIQQRDQYISLSTMLLDTAAKLSGPRDWLKYAQYTAGGQNLFQSLFGQGQVPSFGAPSGVSDPNSVQNLLGQLGINQGNIPQNAAAKPSTAGSVPSLESLLATASGNAAPTAPSQQPAQAATYTVRAGDTLSALARQYGTTVQALASLNGISNPNLIRVGQVLKLPGQAKAATAPSPMSAPVNPGGTAPSAGTSTGSLVPLPHQINPAAWDALSPTAKQMVLGAAEGGQTPSGYWSADDFLTQLEKARPKGQATASPGVQWGQQNIWG